VPHRWGILIGRTAGPLVVVSIATQVAAKQDAAADGLPLQMKTTVIHVSQAGSEAPMAQAAEWYVETEAGRSGPFAAAVLREMAVSGQVTPDSLIWRTGLQAAVPARSVKGLFATPPAASRVERNSSDEEFVNEVLREPDAGETTPAPSTSEADYQHYQLPLTEFPQLKREQLPLVVIGWIFTVSGMLTLLNGCLELSEMVGQEDAIIRKTYFYVAAASISAGLVAIAVGSILRTLAGSIDLGIYLSKLMYDIRRQGRRD